MGDHQSRSADSELEFTEVVALIWRAKWFIALATLLCVSMGLAYVLLATPMYRAEVTLVRKENPGGSGALAQLGGLASLAGINVGGAQELAPVAVIRSRSIAREFIEQHKLLPVLFPDIWDPATGGLQKKGGRVPDIRDAVNKFDRRIRAVADDKKSGLVTVSMTWSDGEVAAFWANELVRMTNDRMRQETLAEAERNVRYLRAEIASSNTPSLQQSVGRVLEAEMQKLMLAKGNEEFAFQVIDNAEPPTRPVSPRKAVILAGCVLLGLMSSFVLVVLRRAILGGAPP